MEIRELTSEDFAGFARVMGLFLGHAGNPDAAREELRRLFAKVVDPAVNLWFCGAFTERRLIGLVSLTFAESSYKVAPFAWCDDLYVEAEYRKQGIARSLMRKAQAVATARGCSNILLGAGEGESEVLRFYQELGFCDMNNRLLTLPM